MGELRQDPATGEWVILAPNRGKRPHALSAGVKKAPLQDRDPSCPFCPTHEDRTPPTLYADPPGPDWQVRVCENKFPALRPQAGPDPTSLPPLFSARAGRGHHEVIIESPRHSRYPAAMSVAELARVLAAYRERYRTLVRQPGIRHVQLFRNQGPRSGASLPHPHAQIVALPLVPPQTRRRWNTASRYYRTTRRCLYCDLIAGEEAAGERWILGGPEFVAFTPYAPRYVYEVWILPREHSSDFGSLADAQLPALAATLKAVLARLEQVLGSPDYNLVLHTRPGGAGAVGTDRADYHWHLQVAPRLYPDGGFEVATGMGIVTQTPEEAARDLRENLREEFPEDLPENGRRGE